jgi:hypothetical protein
LGDGGGGGTGGGGGGTTCTGKLMFVTAVNNGNFGGALGADATCNGHKPSGYSGSNFKAYVADVGSRASCYVAGDDNCGSSTVGRLDWPLAANTTYCSLTAETIGTTSSAALMNAIGYVDSAHTYKYFTGFNGFYGISISNNCADFSTTGGAASTAGKTDGGFGGGQFLACNSAGYILCVEQ